MEAPPKIRDERIRLFATYLNNLAAGSFVAGFIAPLIALSRSSEAILFPTALYALMFASLSVCLHLAASAVLGRLGR